MSADFTNRPDRTAFLDEDDPRRRVVEETLRSADLDLAVVHGSRARGRGREGSDLDIGLLAAGARPLSYGTLGRIAQELSRILGVEVDPSDLSTPDAVFRFEVAGCARPLFEARPGAFTDFLARALIDYSDIQRFLPDLVAGVARGRRRVPWDEPGGADEKGQER